MNVGMMEVLCGSPGEWIRYVHYQPLWKCSRNKHQSTHGVIYAHELMIWTTFVGGHEHWRWVSEHKSQGWLPGGKVWQGESWSWGRHIGRCGGHDNQENHFVAGITGTCRFPRCLSIWVKYIKDLCRVILVGSVMTHWNQCLTANAKVVMGNNIKYLTKVTIQLEETM